MQFLKQILYPGPQLIRYSEVPSNHLIFDRIPKYGILRDQLWITLSSEEDLYSRLLIAYGIRNYFLMSYREVPDASLLKNCSCWHPVPGKGTGKTAGDIPDGI